MTWDIVRYADTGFHAIAYSRIRAERKLPSRINYTSKRGHYGDDVLMVYDTSKT